MRVRTTLPVPTQCDVCNTRDIKYYDNLNVPQNPNKRQGLWVCKAAGCGALATTPYNSRHPHGTMARREVRQLRMDAHEIFDLVWKQGIAIWTRDEAYEWVAVALEVPLEECNISRLSKENLVILIGLCEDRLRTNQRIWERRHKKKQKRHLRQNKAEIRLNSIEKGNRIGAHWKNPVDQAKRLELRYKAKDEL